MNWFEVQVWADGPTVNKILVNAEAVSQLGSMKDHGVIVRLDGGTVETVEDYPELIRKLRQCVDAK
jgi:hypothetical protein